MEEENEKVVEETTQETTEQVDESKFESAGDDSVIKVDLSKPIEPEQDEVKENNADDSGVVAESENAEPTQEQEEVQPEAETQETPVLEEITEEEVEEVEEQVEEAIAEAEATGKPLPENIQKLMDFMEDTGGDLNDYVKLNQDYSKLDEHGLIKEGTIVNDETAVIGLATVISPIPGTTLNPTSTFVDNSKFPKKGQLGIVDKSFIGRNPPEEIMVKAKFNEFKVLIPRKFKIIKIKIVVGFLIKLILINKN